MAVSGCSAQTKILFLGFNSASDKLMPGRLSWLRIRAKFRGTFTAHNPKNN